MRNNLISALLLLITSVCFGQATKDSFYYKKTAQPGVKFIPVYGGKYEVFTQKVGNGKIKLLLLHGSPAITHEYFENFPAHFSPKEATIYYYDQLGSYYSDQPRDSTIWDINRFVEEVEEVRKGLGLQQFYILGHSWGATLAQLYAAKYPTYLKGIVLSNPPAHIKDTAKWNKANKAFGVKLWVDIGSSVEARGLPKATVDSLVQGRALADSVQNRLLSQLVDKTYDSILMTFHYRLPGELPEPMRRTSLHMNRKDIEKMKDFSRQSRTYDYSSPRVKITCPVLLIGGRYDRMMQELYPEMKKEFSNAKVRIYMCNGGHFSMWDDTENYFREVKRFLREVENKSFHPEQ